jgi:hypothetical protein
MNNVYEISPKDKRLLESFDISMFTSAVAYIQHARNSSCQASKSQESKSPVITWKKSLKKPDPPLLPIESRIAILTQKYGVDSSAIVKRSKFEHRPKIVEIFNYKRREIPESENIVKSVRNIDELHSDKGRFTKHLRTGSLGVRDSR